MMDLPSSVAARTSDIQCLVRGARGDEAPARLVINRLPNDEALLKLDGLDDGEVLQARFRVTVPIIDMTGIYLGGDPGPEFGHLPFWHHEKYMRANSGFPYVALHNTQGQNRFALGLVDQLLNCRITLTLDEAGRCYHIELRADIAASDRERLSRDGLILFVSQTPDVWQDVLGRYRALAESALPSGPIAVPDSAFDPVFCTWTAAHHGVTGEWCEDTARVAATLGIGTWLTDDGWFTKKAAFGRYDQVGDWQPDPEKFPDFRTHVSSVRAMGLRYLLWIAPLMVGGESSAHAAMSGILTEGRADLHAGHLSPTAPGAAEHVANLFDRLMSDFGVDGFKIDFVDALQTAVCPAVTTDDGFGVATFDLLRKAIDRVLTQRPDALIEFRNTYTNIAAASLANIYRASDVPLNPDLNLWQVTMLRLMAPGRAIHMDPMFWHPDESDRNVALQLMRGLAGVPMISVRLTETRASHLALIRQWLAFYNRHRPTLWQGTFAPLVDGSAVRQLCFTDSAKHIVLALSDSPVDCPSVPREQIVLNASPNGALVLILSEPSQLVVSDMSGKEVAEHQTGRGTVRMDVEPGGSIVVQSRPESKEPKSEGPGREGIDPA
ncbi:MAG: alpha-galactosidase [Rubellimicrobium sp.]|nr:alpha-galactosidase [Rubellimicrobium sp.]